MNSMLSFTRGTPIAVALDKTGHVVHVIHITPDEKLPDIEADDVLELLDSVDINAVKRALHLGLMETKILQKAITDKSPERLNEPLKRAYEILEEKAHDKLKKEIFFTDGSVSCVVPLIGSNPEAFDRSIVLIGPSGAGKSYLAKQICMMDRRKRRVVLFSKVTEDPSLKDLTRVKTVNDKPRLIQIPVLCDDDLVNLPVDEDLKGTICMFDDLDAFKGERAQFLRDYRDALLEAGRHKNVTVISTSHVLSNYNKTRVMLNEALWTILFPPANRRCADAFLKDRMGLVKQERDTMIARANSAGRYMGVYLACPNLMIHAKGIMLL